jgi:hypothetical protein
MVRILTLFPAMGRYICHITLPVLQLYYSNTVGRAAGDRPGKRSLVRQDRHPCCSFANAAVQIKKTFSRPCLYESSPHISITITSFFLSDNNANLFAAIE